MITLHKLHLFVAVYERGSFNRAAADLTLAQSAVSGHIADLEASFGVALFTRTAQGARPTPAGDLLYDHARRILALVVETERAMLQLEGAAGRTLAVAATPGVSAHLLPPWLSQFQSAYPKVAVSLQTPLTADLVRDLLDGAYDLGYLEGDEGEVLDHPALGVMRVRDVAYAVTVSHLHPWAARASVRVEELPDQPFINRLPSSRMRRWLEPLLRVRAVHLNTVAELDNPDAIKVAVLNGMGIGILPDYVTAREVASGELARLTIDGLPLTRAIVLVWDKRRPLTPMQRAFARVTLGGAEVE